MRSEHNHPVDEPSYESFLNTAIKVRKFTKKGARHPLDTTAHIESLKRLSQSAQIPEKNNKLSSENAGTPNITNHVKIPFTDATLSKNLKDSTNEEKQVEETSEKI